MTSGRGSWLGGLQASGEECLLGVRKQLPAGQLARAKRQQGSLWRLIGEFIGFSPPHLPAGEDHDSITRLQKLVEHDVHDGVGLRLLVDPLPDRLRSTADASGRLDLHLPG
jgi:hypothetical protein